MSYIFNVIIEIHSLREKKIVVFKKILNVLNMRSMKIKKYAKHTFSIFKLAIMSSDF